MIDTSSLDKVGEYIEQLKEGGKQARERVIELVDKLNKAKDLFNKRDMTGKDEFLEELGELLRG